MEPTDEQVDAFISVWIEHGELPWPWADVHDYLHDGVQGEERDRAIAEMKAEDQRQEAANREFVRRALRAAFDAEQREATPMDPATEGITALPEHLRDDAPYAVCDRCGRKTWDADQFGTEDRMTQPDGNPCGGRLVASR